MTTYAYTPDGSISDAFNTDSGRVSYEWTASQRLQAVRQGGVLLMAVSYDGDGNKVFQADARPVKAEGVYVKTGGSVFSWRDDDKVMTPGGAFWYGFAQSVAQQVGGLNGALSVAVMAELHQGYARVEIRLPDDSGVDQADVDGLSQAGVTLQDVQDIVTEMTAGTVLPTTIARVTGFEWDVTHYVNDVNTVNTRVVAEYGRAGMLTADYTYGVGRVNQRATGASPTTTWLAPEGPATGWYVTDGRGSVTGVADQTGSLVQAMSYDPWGVPTQSVGATSSTVFGWNGEEYSPVTGLQYLRARWFEPTSARFISADTVLGDPTIPASWNQYGYGWGDPVNQVDPSGQWPAFLDKAVTVVKSAASAVYNNVVKPVVNAVTTAASAVYNNVVKPAVNWVNNNVVKPVVSAFSNAASAAASVAQTVYHGAAGAYQMVSQAAQIAYRSTAAYVQARTAELKQHVIEFACTTANKLNDAWQATKQAVESVPWGTVGKVALMVGGAALTVATLGAAGPVVGAIMVAGLVASTAMDINDMVADATGTNFIKDKLLGGNEALYAGLEIGVAVVGLVGPGGAGNAAKLASKADDMADVVQTIKNGSRAADAGDAAKTADRAEDAAQAANAGNKAENATAAGSTPSRVGDEPPKGCLISQRPKSFTVETMVLMGDGTRQPIGDVQVGDRVMAYDPGTNIQSVESVTATWPHQDEVVTLTLSRDVEVETTASHPWWVESRRAYVRTDHLNPGDQVLTADGSTLSVEGMSGSQGWQQVYNLTVTGPHTYYVAETSILVHNCDGEPIDDLLQADYFHYTSNSGAAKIAESGVIRPGTDGKVYLTDQMYSPDETLGALFAGDPKYVGKGSSVVGVKIPEGTELIHGTQPNEVFTSGSIRPQIVYSGENPF